MPFAGDAHVNFGMPPEPRRVTWNGLVFALIGRALLNPAIARDLLRVAWRFRRREWYRRFPFLPVPPAEYVRWRMYTAYGSEDAVPPAEDVVRYARWVTRQG